MIYVALTALWCLALITIAARALARARRDALGYRLFALRDRLLRLAITGVVPEDHITYQVTCDMIHGVIRNIDDFTLHNFMRAVRASEDRIAHAAVAQEYVDALNEGPGEMRELVADYFTTVIDILRRTSPLLRIWLSISQPLRRGIRSVTQGFPRPPVLDLYNHNVELLAAVRDPHDRQLTATG